MKEQEKQKGKGKNWKAVCRLKMWGEIERAKTVELQYVDENGRPHHRKNSAVLWQRSSSMKPTI